MKKNIPVFSLIGLLIAIFGSCSEKFKVGAPHKNVTVVYGLLNVSDTAHYVKITKGFFDEARNNIDLAKIPDSIYYNMLDVKMDVKSGSSIVKTITLDKVKLSDEGITKDTGVFANNPAYAYKFKENLNTANTYELRFLLPDGKEIKGITSVLGGVTNATLSGGYILNFADRAKAINFNWVSPPNAGLVEYYLRFKYVEENLQTSTTQKLFVDLPIILNYEVSPTNLMGNYVFDNINFYYLLNSHIPVKGAQYIRWVDTFTDIIAFAGSREIADYINQNKAQGGLTADQIKPIFSNLFGGDVYGIFSSRSKKVFPNVKLSRATIDSMVSNDIVNNLQFKGIIK
jgi:hypothetical protein